MLYFVYMLLCGNNSFYTGHTKNLSKRIGLHVNGKGARYTRMYKPKKLVYVEKFDSQVKAMKRERKIKQLSHRQKLELVKSQINASDYRR